MPDIAQDDKLAETPADVAALYAWAHIEGIQYRDFSAERRVAREEARRRGASARRQAGAPAPPGSMGDVKGAQSAPALVPAAALLPSAPLATGSRTLAALSEMHGRSTGRENMLPQRFPRRRQASELTAAGPREAPEPTLPEGHEDVPGPARSARQDQASGVWAANTGMAPPAMEYPAGEVEGPALRERPRLKRTIPGSLPEGEFSGYGRQDREAGLPAWLSGAPGQDAATVHPGPGSPVSDTLQHSRERVASRWYALRGVFDPAVPAMEPTQARVRSGGSSVLAIFSLAGGVGKTSLTAAIGRTLSSQGENVLLAEVSAHGMLPYFFGATELRAGVVRKFLPPSGSKDAPVSVLSFELGRGEKAESIGKTLEAELERGRDRFDRILVDLSPMAPEMIRPLLEQDANVLVPVAPDMNAVIGLAAVERFFAELRDAGGRPVQPRYVLTQFDAAQPLHLDVREVMRQQLEDRLLPFVIRRAPSVAEALAEGMTVIDYAPDAEVAADHRELASWVQDIAQKTSASRMPSRWSER